jgi:hypothetical protein
VSHAAAFYALLGGGTRDAGWEGSGRSEARLAIVPGATHYDLAESALFAAVVDAFLG